MADLFEIVGKISLDGVDKAERELNGLSDSGEKSSSKLSKFGKVMGTVGKGVLAVGTAVGAGSVALVKGVSSSYGELQQNLGGSEAVFGKYASNIQKIGESAYKTMGISQSQYLATANKMGSLLQGSGIKQKESLDMTAKAMQRASDVASVMGIDMEMAMESITGACKGNFTMMDNLGVAMNATTLEAYAHSKGIENFTWKTASQAEKNSLAMQMFLERTQQYAGNFARESTDTISGSIGYLGAAWQDFMAGLGNPSADMARLTNNLAQSFGAMINNITPIIENITKALPTVMTSLISAVTKMLPTLITTFTTLVKQVIDGIVKLLPTAIPLVVECLMSVVEAIIKNLPQILNSVVQLVSEVINSLAKLLPTLLPLIIKVVVDMANSLIQNLPTLLNSVLQLVQGIMEGLIQALPMLIQALPTLITGIVNFLVQSIPQIIQAGITLLMALIEAIPVIINALVVALPQIVNAIVTGLINNLPLLIDASIQLFMALVKAIPIIIVELVKALPQIITTIMTCLGKLLPSIGTLLLAVIAKVGLFFRDLIKTGVTKAGEFVTKVVGFIKKLPENFAYWLGFVLGKVAKFVVQLPAKASEAGKKFVNNLINFIKNLPSNVATWLTNTISKLSTFVTNVGRKASEAGKKMLDNVVNGIKNLPSKIKSIGSDVIKGLWNGIVGAGDWLYNKVNGFCDNIVKGFKKGFDIHSPSRKMRDQVGKNIALGIIEGVDSQKKNAKKSAKELSELYVSSAKSRVTELKKANKLNEAQEVEFWDNIRKHCVKGTDAYKTATNQMVIAKNNLNSNIKELDKQYKENVQKIKTDLIKNIQDVTNAYDKAVRDRQSQIISSLNLFEEFKADDPITKMDLTNNLKSQVIALKEWDTTLDQLSKRKGVDSSGLLDDLENMGVKSLDTLKQLNSMSDEELAQYISLYRQKNAVALERSEAEHKELKKQSEKQIKELTKQANNQLNALEKTYVSKLKSMGVKTADKSVSIGKDIVNGLKKGISSQNASFQAYLTNFFNSIVSNAKNSLQIKSPSRVFRDQVGKFISEGIGVGITEDDSPEKSMKNKVASILGIVDNVDANINVGTSVDDIVNESPLQKYQLDFNAQLDSLNDGFDRLLALIGQYLPNIADNMDRNIVLDGNSLVVGMSRRMDAQLGKISTAKGRGNV